MRKEIEINGCVEIPCEISIDEFTDAFIEWVEQKVGILAADLTKSLTDII